MDPSNESKDGGANPKPELDPVDAFLEQPDFEEEAGLDEAALERQRLLEHDPDADDIVAAIELLNEHHQSS
ncbi:MAG: hypothetical protein WAN30_09525 [Acidimicrobiales bacterium]